MGVYTDLTFGYNDFLYLNLTGRTDWSSTLPQDKRNYYYGSASTSLIFSEWLGLSERIFSEGKVRAGYARVGNDADPYQLTNLFSVNRGSTTGLIGSLPDNDLPFNGKAGITRDPTGYDPDLNPEFTDEFEVGTNLNFFVGRIEVDFTYLRPRNPRSDCVDQRAAFFGVPAIGNQCGRDTKPWGRGRANPSAAATEQRTAMGYFYLVYTKS